MSHSNVFLHTKSPKNSNGTPFEIFPHETLSYSQFKKIRYNDTRKIQQTCFTPWF
mgnify:CR=1 FL=1